MGKYKENTIYTVGDICIMLPTNAVREAIIFDSKYYDVVKEHTWSIRKNTSGVTVVLTTLPETMTTVKLSRLICNNPKGKVVFHINGDKLDNRECNLRIGTYSEFQKTLTTKKSMTREKNKKKKGNDELCVGY